MSGVRQRVDAFVSWAWDFFGSSRGTCRSSIPDVPASTGATNDESRPRRQPTRRWHAMSRPLRRHHHRHRRRRRHARPHAGRRRASRSCSSSAATSCRARWTTGIPTRCSSTASTSPRRPGTTPTAQPFQPQVHYYVGGATKLLRRRAVPPAPAGLRRAAARRRHLARVAARATTTSSRSTRRPSGSTRCTATTARTRPKATASEAVPVAGGLPRAAHPAAVRRPGRRGGYHPFHAPCGILLDEADRPQSTCIRCTWCDGYPVPRARQVRRRDHRRAPDPRPAERHAARRRRGRRGSRPTPAAAP